MYWNYLELWVESLARAVGVEDVGSSVSGVPWLSLFGWCQVAWPVAARRWQPLGSSRLWSWEARPVLRAASDAAQRRIPASWAAIGLQREEE